MKIAKFSALGVALTLVLTTARPSPAQIVDFASSPGYSNMINNMISNHIWNTSMANYTKTYNKGGSGSASKSPSSGQPATYQVPAYRAYPAVQFKSTGTRVTLQEYLDAIQGPPEVKAEAKTLVLDIFQKYEATRAAKEYPNDWALAYVSYVGLNSLVYNGITEKPILPFEQNVGLRDVVAEYATDNGVLTKVPDRKKQEFYELLVMSGGLTYHFYEKALRENNAEELKQIKSAAAQNLKMVGLKP
ncbi:MAG TPA: DUF6683 family protein [bacterium]|nr:DUF6683 family protein [bacterium]